MTKPVSRDERLARLAAIVEGIRWGMPCYDARLVEMAAGFPAGGSGGGSKGDHADPTCDQAAAIIDKHRRDPAKEARRRFDQRLEAAERVFGDLLHEYSEVTHVRMGKTKTEDPGCELCNQVPDHWCMTYATVKVTSKPKRKGEEPIVRPVRLCSWCYSHQRPDRAGRMPSHDEVLLHAQGRRVHWKVGA